MKKTNSVIIIGCSLTSLYAGLKCLELGYRVTIIERKNSILPVTEKVYDNYKLFNDNHKSFLNLLNRFDIKYVLIENITFEKKLLDIINEIMIKSKHIPNTILMTYTFTNLCKHLLNDKELNVLKSYESILNGIFNVMNAYDCINMFFYDIVIGINYYSINTETFNILIDKMMSVYSKKGGKIIYSNDVKNIKYIKKKFLVNTSTNLILHSDILVTTMSRNKLLSFNFWNQEQKKLLNSVSIVNSSIISNIITKLINSKNIEDSNDELRTYILNNLHIVFPLYTNKSKNLYVWNSGINNIIWREKIKNIYNDKFFLCSESFSKNNMFINYSLEFVENTLLNLPNVKYTIE